MSNVSWRQNIDFAQKYVGISQNVVLKEIYGTK
jgi:hypothetical protein